MTNQRNASAVLFGIDFQVNAAIVLMLEYIKDLKSLKLEGAEDIELNLNNNKSVLAQAKSVINSSYDFSNVKPNLKKALITLSEAAQKNNAQKLIFITNSPNPLKDEGSRSIFYGHSRRDFDTLPPSAKKIIQNILSNIPNALETSKFAIHVLPFETEDEKERHKVVHSCIDDFIGSINATFSPGISAKLFNVWNDDIFNNGVKRNEELTLSKKSIIWPLLVVGTDAPQVSEDFSEQFDIGTYEEVYSRYQQLIDSCCERIDFFTKVLYDYNNFESKEKNNKKYMDFIKNCWCNYKEEFSNSRMNEEVMEFMIKVILYNIIKRRILIDEVKKRVNL